LHQGSIFELPEIDLALAQTDGSIIKLPKSNQIVAAVGKYTLFGMNVFNCYFGDGKTYVQLITKNGVDVLDARLWCSNSEILPQSTEEWEFWLGSYKKDENGNLERDESGKGIKAESGLIGWHQFQVDGPPSIIYNRLWSPGPEGIDPIDYTETITDRSGTTSIVRHEGMEYYRNLTNAKDSLSEFLLATVTQGDEGASVNVFIGIPLDRQNMKILRS